MTISNKLYVNLLFISMNLKKKKNYTQHQTHANIREIKLDCLNEWMEIKETSLL
jgi:hypothetical protein